jgi:hypothetical protein
MWATDTDHIEDNMAVNSFADKVVKRIFGTSSDIFLKRARPIVEKINALEPSIEKLSDDELKAQTPKFKERIAQALEGIEDKDERRKAEGHTPRDPSRSFRDCS